MSRSDQDIIENLRQFGCVEELATVRYALDANIEKRVFDCEMPCRLKLGKSLVYRNEMKSGEIVTIDDICVRVAEPFGISAERLEEFAGRTLCVDVFADNILEEVHFKSM